MIPAGWDGKAAQRIADVLEVCPLKNRGEPAEERRVHS
jgi:hypothetical protein